MLQNLREALGLTEAATADEMIAEFARLLHEHITRGVIKTHVSRPTRPTDPRQALAEMAKELAASKKISFVAALEQINQSDEGRELVERYGRLLGPGGWQFAHRV